MRLSKQLNSSLLKVPSNYEKLDTYTLIDKIGLYSLKRSGQPFYLPLGEKLFDKLEHALTDFASSLGFEKIHQQILIPWKLIKNRESIDDFYDQIYFIKNEEYCVLPTTEDLSIEILENALISYKQLPIKWFSLQDVIRNIPRPEKFMKTKQIRCLSMISFSSEKDSYYILKSFEKAFDDFLYGLRIQFQKDSNFKDKGIEYLYPCKCGEKKINNENVTSLGMVYRYVPSIQINYINKNNEKKEITILTFGIGLQRILFAIIDSNRNEKGINFPDIIRPFEFSIIFHRGDLDLAEKCYSFLKENKKDVYFDDRNINFKDKMDYADFLGVPYKVIIGKNSKESALEIKTSKDVTLFKSLEELLI